MDKKITQLTQVTELTGAELLPLAQGGVTKSASVDQLRGYQVYTALLTQSGSDGISTGISASPLIVGTTYLIEDNGGSGWDFTNVGAPNNNIGTYFVATGTTPNSWGIDGLLAYTPAAPVVTVLENTIGNIWWTYNNAGQYYANSNGLFSDNKCYFSIVSDGVNSLFNTVIFSNSSQISVSSFVPTGDPVTGFNSANDLLVNTPIEIRVYN
jgi:hypothetical protein